jgi:hypothetical protein
MLGVPLTTIFKSFDTYAARSKNMPACFEDMPACLFWGSP